jgi:OOP family OmpA-OmpF porin
MAFGRMFLAAATVVAMPVLAQAQPVSGLYLGAGIGRNSLDQTNFSSPSSPNTSFEFSRGSVRLLSLGWGFGNGLRAEIELNDRSNDVSAVKISGAATLGPRGEATSRGTTANLLYDINLGGALGGITPYIGAGAGYIRHRYNGAGNGFNTVSGDNSDWGVQAIVGLSLPIAAVPGLAVTAEYRFMKTAGHNIATTFSGGGDAKFDVDNVNKSLLIGLRYAFQ